MAGAGQGRCRERIGLVRSALVQCDHPEDAGKRELHNKYEAALHLGGSSGSQAEGEGESDQEEGEPAHVGLRQMWDSMVPDPPPAPSGARPPVDSAPEAPMRRLLRFLFILGAVAGLAAEALRVRARLAAPTPLG